MESLYLLIPLSVAIVFFALWVFFKAMDSGQFDDLDTPPLDILDDENAPPARKHGEAASRPPVKPQALGLGLLLAELQQKRGQNAAAVVTYRRLANEFPQDQRPLLGLALLQQQLGDRSAALAALNEGRQRLMAGGGASDPGLERLATSWGLAPLRAPAAPGPVRPGVAGGPVFARTRRSGPFDYSEGDAHRILRAEDRPRR